ncbi:hypothetical protein L2E82_13895 [Cichorium intybus]|uniref:Uncharacterized protein n=1 Tax=Cichorium intybus TaxID=13427 RepID=A0ACB9EYH6_CICIN|nr:hypothetical protein L2E82_13895 [Cichorium intybus]
MGSRIVTIGVRGDSCRHVGAIDGRSCKRRERQRKRAQTSKMLTMERRQLRSKLGTASAAFKLLPPLTQITLPMVILGVPMTTDSGVALFGVPMTIDSGMALLGSE